MQRRDLDELIELEIKPNAKSYAENIHEMIAQAMVEGLTKAAEESRDPYLMCEADVLDLVLPALKSETYWHLSRLARAAAQGWAEVVERNLA